MCSENPKFLVYRFEDIFIILVREELLSMYLAFQQGWALSAEKLISEKAQKCEKPHRLGIDDCFWYNFSTVCSNKRRKAVPNCFDVLVVLREKSFTFQDSGLLL